MAFTTNVYANMLATYDGKRLNADRLRRVVEATSLSDAFKMLADYGFYYTEGVTVDAFIVEQANRLIEFITDNVPNKAFVEALNARFVYNNAKLAYKSRFHRMPSDGYYRIENFDTAAIAAGNYDDADKYMREALEALDAANETSPQKIDFALARAMYEKISSCGIPIVKKYVRAEIDMKNILSAARMLRLGIDRTDEFLDGGTIKKETLAESAASDAEHFSEFFENTKFAEYAQNIASALGELWRAERDADDYLYYMTETDVLHYTSNTPLLNYYIETLIELKTVKTALVAVKTSSRDSFYARLNKIYEE